MMSNEQECQPHVAMDGHSRTKKAKKIKRLLSMVFSVPGSRVLEAGTGAGFIAAHFAVLLGPRGIVHAVDVVDQRRAREGFEFTLVTDTTLPFGDASFDICISNHVNEHVGDRLAQAHHLREIKRVLRPNGWHYLTVPNRWALVEPHFKLPYLSWLPRPLRDAYVRAAGRGSRHDCAPPSHGEIKPLLFQAGYAARDVSFEGIRAVGELEVGPGLRRRLLQNPQLWARPMRAILPTLLYLAQAL